MPQVDSEMVLPGLGRPSLASCQLAEYNYAGQTTRFLPVSNPLPLGYEPSIIPLDHTKGKHMHCLASSKILLQEGEGESYLGYLQTDDSLEDKIRSLMS